ncbi:MAG: hypothetical protein ACI9KE_003620 [Polyangiales bacterium]|jgi:hypothetical protein
MKRRKLADDDRAAVYVEFLVVFMPLWMLFLVLIQTSMLFTAKLVVGHASYRAARSAVVVLPDDPANYNDNPVNRIEFDEVESSDLIPDVLSSLASFLGIRIPGNFLAKGNSRLNMIRLATALPLLALAPPPQHLLRTGGIAIGGGGKSAESILDAIGENTGGQLALRFTVGLAYTAAAMAVTFPVGPGGDAQTTGGVTPATHVRGSTRRITARVTFLYPCMVPGAAQMMCDGWNDLAGPGAAELDAALAAGVGLASSRGVYYALRAETTMTYHGASYAYQ